MTYLVNISKPVHYHIYAMVFPIDLRCESVTCVIMYVSFSNKFLLMRNYNNSNIDLPLCSEQFLDSKYLITDRVSKV